MTLAFPKPERRGPKPRRPIPRRSALPKRTKAPRRRSRKRSIVERADSAWSLTVRDRYRGYCERSLSGACVPDCMRWATDAHHVRSKKAHPEMRWLLANGVALCRPGHNDAHRHGSAFRAWFRQHRPADYAAIYATEGE